MKRINLGGWERLEGGPGSSVLSEEWEHVDLRKSPGVTYVGDVRELPNEWTGLYDEVRASHVIEHVSMREASATISGWVRILKRGGLLRIYSPNFRLLAQDLLTGLITIEHCSRYVFGEQDYFLNLHRAAYDQDSLIQLVESVGMTVISTNPRPNAYRYDIGVQATK
jgi:predicted SAM-dependent methyltransferase